MGKTFWTISSRGPGACRSIRLKSVSDSMRPRGSLGGVGAMQSSAFPLSTDSPEPSTAVSPLTAVTDLPSPAMTRERAQPSLRELAAEAQAKPGAATHALLARVRELALRYMRARLGRFGIEDAAQDVAQEVCMAVLSALPTFEERGYPFEAFVYAITARKVADAQRGIFRSAVPVAEIPESVDAAPGPEAVVLLHDDSSRLMTLMDNLPAAQREIIVLRVAMGMSTEETAAALGMSAGAVRVAQHRGLSALRSMLSKLDAEVAS